MADKYYDSPLTGEELDAAMRVLPTMPTLAETAQTAAAAAAESEQTAADHESRAQDAAEAAAESARQAAESAGTVDMSGYLQKAEADETYAPIEAGVATYTHSRSGSVHNLAGQGANGRVQLTADVQVGDTWTVNGEPVKAYMGAADATETMAGESYTGRWLTFVYEDGTINFKGGGGGSVTVSGLSAATVKAGSTVTVKQGVKTVRSVSGTFTRDATAAAANILAGKTAYVNGNKVTGTMPDRGQSQYGNFGSGNGYVAINGMPEGYYWSGGASWAPEARIYNNALAAGIGLTAAKIMSGNTILGIAGTGATPTYSMISIPTATGSTGMSYCNIVRLANGGLSVTNNSNGSNINSGGEVTLYEDDYVRITIGTVWGQAQQRAYYCKKAGMRVSYKSAGGVVPSGLDSSGWTTVTVSDTSRPALMWTATYSNTYHVLVTT